MVVWLKKSGHVAKVRSFTIDWFCARTRSVSEGEVHVSAGEGRRSHMYTHGILRPHATVSQRVHECDELICREQSRATRQSREVGDVSMVGRGKDRPARASAHRIVESPIKSIRVLKGMQQCEETTPPPEPSGQRKQTAASCMLHNSQNARGDNGGPRFRTDSSRRTALSRKRCDVGSNLLMRTHSVEWRMHPTSHVGRTSRHRFAGPCTHFPPQARRSY